MEPAASGDVAERIKQRTARQQERAAARTGGSSSAQGAAGVLESQRVSKAVQRVADAMNVLDATKSATITEVTDIRVAAHKREHSHRLQLSQQNEERAARIKEETTASDRSNAAVQMKWADIQEKALPQDMAAELETQKKSCSRILQSKDALISSLLLELKKKDEEYILALQAQRDDVSALLERMKGQFEELRDVYEEQLRAIEGSFMEERAELLAANKKDVDALFDARRSMETKYVEDKLAKEESRAAELYDLQAADAENYQKLKVKLETDVAILEQQLEHMRFTYLLNTEKLEYNFRVLSERDNENKATLAAQKQRLARLRSTLAKVQADYEASDAKFRTKNQALTTEYERITRQYRDLQSKYRHFEAADAQRYAEVVSLHREEMRAMVDRLLAADKVITEQLLGLSWTPPTAVLAALDGQSDAAADDAASSAAAEGGAGAAEAAVAADPAQLRVVLRLLVADCASALLEAPVQEAALKLASQGRQDEAEALAAESILRTLGCNDPSSVASLVTTFSEALGAAKPNDGSSPKSGDGWTNADPLAARSDGLPAVPAGFSTLKVVRSWLSARKGGEHSAQALAKLATGDETRGPHATARSQAARATQDLWTQLANAVPTTQVRVWKALEQGLLKYKAVLTQRATVLNQCDELNHANAELRSLLAQYVASPAAASLQVPPSQTVRLPAEVLQQTAALSASTNKAPAGPAASKARTVTGGTLYRK